MDKLKEFTNGREILMAIGIFLIMVVIGIGIFFVGSESTREGLRQYEVAYKTDSEAEFQHAKRTKLGDVLAFGKFSAIGSVFDERIEGEYLAIKVITERYTMHTRTTTDSDGKTEVEMYYTWDYWTSDNNRVDGFTFLGLEGNAQEIPDFYNYLETVYDRFAWWPLEGDLRHRMYVIPTEFSGTGFWSLSEEIHLKEAWLDKNVEETMTMHRSNSNAAPIGFSVFWGLLTMFVTGGFVYLENRWLHE